MQAKLTGTEAYLEQWRKSDPTDCGDDLEAAAEEAAAALEAAFTPEQLRDYVMNGGHTPGLKRLRLGTSITVGRFHRLRFAT